MIYNNILETIGNTPVVRLNRMGPDHVELYVKVESFNPMASVKDRLALAIIEAAEKADTIFSPENEREVFGDYLDSKAIGRYLAYKRRLASGE